MVKFDLMKLETEGLEADAKYHDWINKHRKNIIRKNKFKKDSIYYDIACNPQDYLKSMFYINKELEKINKNKNNEYPVKLFQVIPKRTNIIPKYITIDSCGLVDLIITKCSSEYLEKITENQQKLWKTLFKVNRSEFKRKKYRFNYMIKTDGIGCSIILRKTVNGIPIKITKKLQKEIREKQKYQYIEDVEI